MRDIIVLILLGSAIAMLGWLLIWLVRHAPYNSTAPAAADQTQARALQNVVEHHIYLHVATPEQEVKRTMAVDNPARYQILPAVDNYGQHEAIDNRTGKRGMMIDCLGFVPGARVRDDGLVVFDNPSDNPSYMCDWS